MAITKRNPNVVHLGGEYILVNHLAAIEEITPGMLLEYHNDSGVLKFGVHDSADAVLTGAFVALDQSEHNLGVDDVYAAGDLVKAAHMQPGATAWMLIPSGQTISPGDLLQSNGDGKLKALGSGVAKFISVDYTVITATADARIRVEVL